MKIEYSGNSQKPGVYKITSLVDGKVYIGSAKCFKVRLNQHLNSLAKNKHQNKHLQSAFNLHGADNFKFEVLESLEDSTKEYRFQIEQEYLDEYMENWEACYNFKKQTIQKERSTHSNTPEETAKIKSDKMSQFYKDHPDLKDAMVSRMRDGFNNYIETRSNEQIEASNNRRKETWQLNHGVDHVSQVPEIRDKLSKTWIKPGDNLGNNFAKGHVPWNLGLAGTYKHTDEAKAAMKLAQANLSPETIATKAAKQSASLMGHPVSDKTKRLISESKYKPCKSINLITGEELLFPSIKHASEFHEISNSCIADNIKGKQHTCKKGTLIFQFI